MTEIFSPAKKSSKEGNTPMSSIGTLPTGPLIYVDPVPPNTSALTARLQHAHSLVVLGPQTASNRHNVQIGAAAEVIGDQDSSSYLSKPDATCKNIQAKASTSPYLTTAHIKQQEPRTRLPTNANTENGQQSPPKKKARNSYGPMLQWKYEILEASFRKNNTPDVAEIYKIMEMTGMDWRKVTKHFSDKRSRMRKLALAEVDPLEGAQTNIQRHVKLYRNRQCLRPRKSTACGGHPEDCTICSHHMAQQQSISMILPALDDLPPYVSMSTPATLIGIQGDIGHEYHRIRVVNKEVARMERDHLRFACSLELAGLQRMAHRARLAGLDFMLHQLGISSDMEDQQVPTSRAGILANLNDTRLCLTTSKVLAKTQFRPIINKLQQQQEEASRRSADLETIILENSVSISASRMRGYRILLVEWQATCLVYRLALTSFIATYYDVEKRLIFHSSS